MNKINTQKIAINNTFDDLPSRSASTSGVGLFGTLMENQILVFRGDPTKDAPHYHSAPMRDGGGGSNITQKMLEAGVGIAIGLKAAEAIKANKEEKALPVKNEKPPSDDEVAKKRKEKAEEKKQNEAAKTITSDGKPKKKLTKKEKQALIEKLNKERENIVKENKGEKQEAPKEQETTKNTDKKVVTNDGKPKKELTKEEKLILIERLEAE